MSQKKMEAYKEAKKNVKQIRKKEKTKRILGWIFGIIIAALLIAGSVCLIYYTNVIKPEQEKAAAEATTEASDASSNVVDQVNAALAGSDASSDDADAAAADDTSDADKAAADDAAAETAE